MNLLVFNLATDADDPILGFTTAWICALAARAARIFVVTMRTGRVEVPPNVIVYSVGAEKSYSRPRRVVEFYRRLGGILGAEKVDVCFSHMAPIFTVLAAPLLRERGIPSVTWYAHPTLTWTLRLAHRLSDRMATSVPTAYPYTRDKLVVLGQGIDTELFAPAGSPPDHPPVVLCAGRLSPVKDHPTLLEATARLRRQCAHPFQVTILGAPARPGDAGYVRSLQERVRALGLGGIVRFEPPVPQAAMPAWYRRCTVHVNLTPTGFGDKVAWEAMACGRPSLAANAGFRETFGTYADRLVFRHGDPEDLAARLQEILALAPAGRDRMGLYLRERVVSLHGLAGLADRLMTLFTSLAEKAA